MLRKAGKQRMQLAVNVEPSTDPKRGDKGSSEPVDAVATRKIGIRLTERVFEKLEAATDRPGVGKSMIVEAALERYLTDAPEVEDLLRQHNEALNVRFDRLEQSVLTLSETVALHARYHFSVMPPLPDSQQREASLLGDQRFRVLAEQVDRRVRLGQPLMQETIDRLYAGDAEVSGQREDESASSTVETNSSGPGEVANVHEMSSAAAGEGGSAGNFLQLPNSFLWPA